MNPFIQQLLSAKGLTAVSYATWNPSDKNAGIVLSGGNLDVTNIAASVSVRATIGKTAGKCCWEILKTTGGESNFGIGTASASLSTWLGGDANGISYDGSDGQLYKNGVAVSTGGSTYGDTARIGIALDQDAGTIRFYRNNVLQYTYTHGLTGMIYPMVGDFVGPGLKSTANFGATALTYTPPAGYSPGIYI